MTKFTNRIKPDSTELERYFLSVYTGNLWDALDKIKDWHSPEHIEKEVQMKLLKLQQQALPVVPEDVDKAIKYLKNHNNSTFSDLGDILTNKGFKWLNDFQFKDRRFGFGGLNNKLFILSHLAITGYTAEKPQQKRYEVKLLSGESMHFNPIGNPKNIKDYRFSFGNYAGWKTKFTKSELSEIKDGMFLKRIPGGTNLDDLGKDKSYYVWIDDCNYWKNPLIELVPVEDGE
ncbi:DUF1642 domain-containing protein [Lactococcus lactis]|uniref:DUF1642 domain-containing protein n=1 Tax=Lactococcus lactis TaxID=1358 RepID=UPI000346615B|nr:DUF1642 domain-containing protein [Lactococcus lactis]